MTTTENEIDEGTAARFRIKVWKEIQDINVLAEWSVELYEVTNIEPPYSLRYGVNENLTCFDGYRYGEGAKIDVEKTQVELAKVIQFARVKKYAVEKKYTDDAFRVVVSIPSGDTTIKATYYADRKGVCKPKTTKKVTIPAREYEEVVEWDCDPVAFTKIDAGVAKPELT